MQIVLENFYGNDFQIYGTNKHIESFALFKSRVQNLDYYNVPRYRGSIERRLLIQKIFETNISVNAGINDERQLVVAKFNHTEYEEVKSVPFSGFGFAFGSMCGYLEALKVKIDQIRKS